MRVDTVMISILAGPTCAVLLFIGLPATYAGDGGAGGALDDSVRVVIAVAAWMAIWWITEAIPMAVMAVLPVTLFPLLGSGAPIAVAEPDTHPLIFLFFEGFLVSIAVQKWALHRPCAVSLLRQIGDDPARIVAGFMLTTTFLSMWLSNTAITRMM